MCVTLSEVEGIYKLIFKSMRFKEIDGARIGYTLDYMTPKGLQLWAQFERLTQKYLKTVMFVVIVGTLLFTNIMSFEALAKAYHLGQYCAVWAQK